MLNTQKPYGIVAGKRGVKYEQDGKYFGPDGNEVGKKEPNSYLDRDEIMATLERLSIPFDKRLGRDKLLNLLEEHVASE
jgi:hypothetical protein